MKKNTYVGSIALLSSMLLLQACDQNTTSQSDAYKAESEALSPLNLAKLLLLRLMLTLSTWPLSKSTKPNSCGT